MNKEEALKRIEAQKETLIKLTGWAVYVYIEELIKSIDEPQKVKVSEEEAKFLETFDFNCESDVTKALYYISRVGFGYYLKNNDGIELKGLSEGFRDLENRKRLIRAILFGYEVEKEKRYRVKMKGMSEENTYLTFRFGQTWMLSNFEECEEFRLFHTRKELEKAGFSEVFNSTLFEVEEVTE